MRKMIFAERKVYENDTLLRKFWISINDDDPKEVDKEIYDKLEIDEFQKIKNIKPSIIKNKIAISKSGECKSSPSFNATVGELIDLIKSEEEEDAKSIVAAFMDAFFDEAFEEGYVSGMKDIEQVAMTLKNNGKKK